MANPMPTRTLSITLACSLLASCATVPSADRACLARFQGDRPLSFEPAGLTSLYQFRVTDYKQASPAILAARMPFIRLGIGLADGCTVTPLLVSSPKPLRSHRDLLQEAAKVCRLEGHGLTLVSFQRQPLEAAGTQAAPKPPR